MRNQLGGDRRRQVLDQPPHGAEHRMSAACECAEQHERDGGDGSEVEREEGGHEQRGQPIRRIAEWMPCHAGSEEKQVGEEPRAGSSTVMEDEGHQRRHQRPQRHGTARNESTEYPHQRERKQQIQGQLAGDEPGVGAACAEHRDARKRERGVEPGDCGCQALAEEPVQRSPHDSQRCNHQRGRQKEELPQPRFFVVARVSADAQQPVEPAPHLEMVVRVRPSTSLLASAPAASASIGPP